MNPLLNCCVLLNFIFLSLCFTLKLQVNPSNPTFNTMFIDKPSRLFAIKHTAIPPLSIRISSLLNLINPINTSVARNRISPTPPWFLPNPIVNFHLSQHSSKASTPPDTYKFLYYELQQSYLQYHEIFTEPSPSYQHLHR